MHKAFKFIGLLLLSLSLTSCIELIEEIKINTDHSGNYHFYLKHNGLSFLFNAIPDDFNLKEFEQGIKKVEYANGISNFFMDINLKKGRFSFSFDFSDEQSLNRAFYQGFGIEKRFFHKSFLKISESKIKRPNLTPYLIKYIESNKYLDQLPNKEILDYVSYRYRLISSKDIKSAKPHSYPSKNKETEYNQVYKFKNLLFEKQSTKSVIRLR